MDGCAGCAVGVRMRMDVQVVCVCYDIPIVCCNVVTFLHSHSENRSPTKTRLYLHAHVTSTCIGPAPKLLLPNIPTTFRLLVCAWPIDACAYQPTYLALLLALHLAAAEALPAGGDEKPPREP
jgi:hypothetical protein